MPTQQLNSLRGLVATVNLTGTVTTETMQSLADLRAYNIEHDFKNIEYRDFPAQLVEAGRDMVCSHALQQNYDFLMQFDGDAAFAPDTMLKLLETAFVTHSDAALVSAYAQLRHPPYLPVIDTGTGTWEVHYPGEGVLPAMRVGGHCFLLKTAALRLFGPPWFRTRQSLTPSAALNDIDNFARIKMHGVNPLSETSTWQTLLNEAKREFGGVSSPVGEDSGFCDALVAAGGRIYANTNIVTGHVTKKMLTANDLRDEIRKIEKIKPLSVGVF